MKRLTPITAATAVLGGLLLTPFATASAAAMPTYTCQELSENGHGKVMGVQDCQASQSAVAKGSFSGSTVLRSRQYGYSFTCTAGGEANIPDTVTANGCTTK
jgi:predicted MFS family arabinose efflux permease